ncbi:hypothetical protein [Anabaena subtropica]|nr:hypothetical protein [Anabaena subtropica]
MQSTLGDELKIKFRQAVEGFNYAEADSLYQWKSHNRYIIANSLSSKKWNVWCGLGYFEMNPESLTEYPYIGIIIEVSPGFKNRQKIIDFMQKIITSKPHIWMGYHLNSPSAWSHISYRKSLREFLSEEDHLSCIKDFFSNCIDEMRDIQSEFDFPWDVLKDESTKESSTISMSSPI